MKRKLQTVARGLGRLGPVYAMVQLTAGCNLKCRMCRVWTLEHKDTGELTLDDYVRMAGILRDIGVPVVTLAGEPLLRPDLPGIVAAMAYNGLSVRLQTNGTLIKPLQLRTLIGGGLKGISISLHTLDPDKADWLAGETDVLDRVLRGINEVVEARTPGFLSILNTVVSGHNIDEVPAIIDFAAERGFRLSIIPMHTSSAREADQQFVQKLPERLQLDDDGLARLRRLVAELKHRRHTGRDVLNSTPFLDMVPEFMAGLPVDWPCHAGTLYAFIDCEGGVAPCHELEPVGSIFDPGVADSLRHGDLGGTSRQARAACPGCLLPCWSELSLVFSNPVAFLEGLEVNLPKRNKR